MRPVRRPIGQGVKLRGPIEGLPTSARQNDPPADSLADEPKPADSLAGEPNDLHPPPEPAAGPIPDDGPAPADLVAVGRIVDSYGVRGWVKVESYNRAEDSVLGQVRRWWLQPASPARASSLITRRATPVACDIERVRSHGGLLVAKPRTSHDRDTALALKGLEVLASRADFPAGEEGEFYWRDLIGCRVENPAGLDLGRVFAVEDYGAHPLLRLEVDGGPQRMIPFVGVYILEVDLAARRILADWSPDY